MTWRWLFPVSWSSGLRWDTGFEILWMISWVCFWALLSCLTKDSISQRVTGGSVGIVLILSALLLNMHLDINEPVLQFLNSLMKEVQPSLKAVANVSLIPFVIGNIILGIALKLGWGVTDPIKSGLQEFIRWPKHVEHDKHLKKAIRRGETYLGFEVTKKKPVNLKSEDRNKHIQVVGSTGSGKTRFTLFPLMRQDIQAGRGVIFIDAKGSSENAKVIWRIIQDAGRTEDFVYFSLTDIQHASPYNPLKHGNPSQLKDKITASIDWSEPFYQRICENALQTLFMDAERIGRRLTLSDLLGILKDPPSSFPNFHELAKNHKSHIHTLESEIGLLVNSPFEELLKEDKTGIDLLDVYKNKKIAYFALDTQSYQHTASRVGKMITQDLNTLSGLIESKFLEKDKKPLAIYIDEFQAFGTRGFINALSRGRSSGFWITIAHQSLGDLKAVDDAYFQQVFENTNTKVFLKVNDPESAQMFSDSVGTTKAVETTSQVLLHGSDPKNIMGSKKIVYEYLIHPTEVKNLSTGRAVYKSGGGFGRLCLSGVFFNTQGIQLPIRRPNKTLPVPNLVPVQRKIRNKRIPSKEEPINI